MKLNVSIFAFLLLALNIQGQKVPVNSVVEHFTNSKCGICASRNPGFHTNASKFPTLTTISIHPSSPYATCSFSQQNMVANDARTNYYSIFGGTPRLVINGNVISSGSNYSDSNVIKPYIGLSSSFLVVVRSVRTATDAMRTEVVITKKDTSSVLSATLFTTVIEDTVQLDGGNGELTHYNVSRAGLQESVTLPLNVGDSVVIMKPITLKSNWAQKGISSLAILQNTSNKQLIQSGLSSKLAAAVTMPNIQGQKVPLNSLVEHFTNTKCGICASRNPGFIANKNRFSTMNSISIHPSSPYASCPLSLQNTSANDARTNFYNIFGGTPRLVINGNVISGGSNYSDSNILKPYIGLSSSFLVVVKSVRTAADAMRTEVVITKKDTSSLQTATLFTTVIEDTVQLDGGNGELTHYNVSRAGLQESVSLPLNVGDSVVIVKPITIKSNWAQKGISSLAILQNTSNKLLIQSGQSANLSKSATAPSNILIMQDVSLTLYPNPASSFLKVQSNDHLTHYTILGLEGRIMQEGNYSTGHISIDNLPQGSYFIKLVNSDNASQILRFSIER